MTRIFLDFSLSSFVLRQEKEMYAPRMRPVADWSDTREGSLNAIVKKKKNAQALKQHVCKVQEQSNCKLVRLMNIEENTQK